MSKSELDILVEDCVWHRLTLDEALKYIELRTGQAISSAKYRRKKQYLTSHRGLNHYFDDHMRLGFLQDYRTRKEEMEQIMDELMRRWKSMTSVKVVNVREMSSLAETINSFNKSLREISLDNPIIAGIKQKVEEHDTAFTASKASSIDYTQGTAFS